MRSTLTYNAAYRVNPFSIIATLIPLAAMGRALSNHN